MTERAEERCKPFFVAGYLVLRERRKVLLLRRYNTGYEDGNYRLIAGHVEPDETVLDALVREAREEVGIEIDRSDLDFLCVVHRKGRNGRVYLDFFFMCDRWGGQPENREPAKCDELSWTDMDNLPDNVISHVRQAIRGLDGDAALYSEAGWWGKEAQVSDIYVLFVLICPLS